MVWDCPGDPHYVGLTSLQVQHDAVVHDDAGDSSQATAAEEGVQVYALTVENLDARPRDLNAIPGHSGDVRTLDKLVDGVQPEF
jgi:hypothetical protein